MQIQIFYQLVNVSLKASILIFFILITKHLLDTKLGGKIHYYIWFIFILRLVIPNLPASNLSFFNLFKSSTKENLYTLDANTIISWFNQSFIRDTSTTGTTTEFLNFYNIFPNIWLLGMLILFLYTLFFNYKFKNKLNVTKKDVNLEIKKVLDKSKERLKIKKDIKIYKSNLIYSPCLYGLFNPIILLPIDVETKINKRDLYYIISHELIHFKRKDLFIYLLCNILKIIYWFNPIIWYGFCRMKQDLEISCDEVALSQLGSGANKNYGLSIIHLLENNSFKNNQISLPQFFSPKKYLKRRIKMIKNFQKSSLKLSLITLFLILSMSCVFLTNANSVNANNTSVNTNDTSVWPVPNYTQITSSYGMKVHPILKKERMHTGIDIAAPKGKDIVAAKSGKVIFADEKGAYGQTIIIDHGDNTSTLYGHCSELLVKENTIVKTGEKIAKTGSTGLATGSHLHFEVRKDGKTMDPEKFLKSK